MTSRRPPNFELLLAPIDSKTIQPTTGKECSITLKRKGKKPIKGKMIIPELRLDDLNPPVIELTAWIWVSDRVKVDHGEHLQVEIHDASLTMDIMKEPTPIGITLAGTVQKAFN